MSKSNQASSLL